MSVDSPLPRVKKCMLHLFHRYSKTKKKKKKFRLFDLQFRVSVACLSRARLRLPHDACCSSLKRVHAKKSSRIHRFLWSIFFSSSSPPLSPTTIPPTPHPHPRSVTVTCKDTCGVTEAVCCGWITAPEIDQPFCTVYACFTAPFCQFSLSHWIRPTVGGRENCGELCILIKGHFLLMSSKDYMLYSRSVVTKQRGIKGKGWINLT